MDSENIFEEVPEGLDETWRHGALLGGMVDLAFGRKAELAAAYKRAGDALVAAALCGEAFELVYPILFTYRHSVELYLKAIVEPTRTTHKFSELVGDFQTAVAARFKVPVPAWLIARLLEFQDVDDRSVAFRYPEPGVHFTTKRLTDEVWVDLPRLRETMNRIERTFEGVIRRLQNPLPA